MRGVIFFFLESSVFSFLFLCTKEEGKKKKNLAQIKSNFWHGEILHILVLKSPLERPTEAPTQSNPIQSPVKYPFSVGRWTETLNG